ncbi:N-acetylglucosamine kinase [Microbacterium sp. MYb54]|nr:N-acetylglucosamine kinase [Microbacterium sp. MYb43]PQZ75043.1 N-acetylglucosamine kinase [Microbacterium sp. MYb40]PRB19366.1 N-acetylglucosamine kinase [Microbacterium sp. MYb54]PRB24568.1 N-acetylglucosamine kinase [Microbacterium sp. MYb50]PRB63413.1 N-acetylglucosamine kinase [Microbacterium sp. MYb24]PRB71920.1 N-acetylglucosamine kinase [Microbacterium sp. MYb32]
MGVSVRGRPALVLAVDGGGSKTDVVLLDTDGEVLAWERGAGSSPQIDGLDESVRVIDDLVRRALGDHEPRELAEVGLYLSGLDLAEEIASFRAAISPLPWADEAAVENDLHALLRAGTDAEDAIAVICGTGMNAIGVRADGAQVRFPALGPLSGDWGGGAELGDAVVWHAARAEDGRGPDTALVALLLRATGAPSVASLIEDVHLGRRQEQSFAALAPVLFEAAAAGDAVARGIVQRQADEVVAFVRACVTRLELRDAAVPVLFGGGVARGRDRLLLESIRSGLKEHAPAAFLQIVDAPPVLGAALLVLGAAGADAAALARARVELSSDLRVAPAPVIVG